jgi:uncharacterized membrane protein
LTAFWSNESDQLNSVLKVSRASLTVNCHLILTLALLRALTQAFTSVSSFACVPIRRFKHCDTSL